MKRDFQLEIKLEERMLRAGQLMRFGLPDDFCCTEFLLRRPRLHRTLSRWLGFCRERLPDAGVGLEAAMRQMRPTN